MKFEDECWFADSLSDEKSVEHSIPVLNEALVNKNYLHKQRVRDKIKEVINNNVAEVLLMELGL